MGFQWNVFQIALFKEMKEVLYIGTFHCCFRLIWDSCLCHVLVWGMLCHFQQKKTLKAFLSGLKWLWQEFRKSPQCIPRPLSSIESLLPTGLSGGQKMWLLSIWWTEGSPSHVQAFLVLERAAPFKHSLLALYQMNMCNESTALGLHSSGMSE